MSCAERAKRPVMCFSRAVKNYLDGGAADLQKNGDRNGAEKFKTVVRIRRDEAYRQNTQKEFLALENTAEQRCNG